jgi:hypothetical protein
MPGAFSIGNGADVGSAVNSLAIGSGATATSSVSIAIGLNANAGNNAVAIGGTYSGVKLNRATGTGSTAVGVGAEALAGGATALGLNSIASDVDAIVIGDGSISSGRNSIGLGPQVTASGLQAIAIGRQSVASHDDSIAIRGVTTAANQFVVGGVSGITIDTILNGGLQVNNATTILRGNDAILGINDITPDFRLELVGTSTNGYFGVTSSIDGDIFTINGSGNVGIGTTSPASKLSVTGDVYVTGNIGVGKVPAFSLDISNSGGGVSVDRTGGSESFVRFSTDGSSSSGGQIRGLISGGFRFTNYLTGTEWLRINSSGNVGIGATTFGTSAAGVLAIKNGTAPGSSPVDMIQLYAEDVAASSELKVRDEAGNITVLSPHNFSLIEEGPSEPLAWSFYSERDGRKLNVDMLRTVRLVEALSGERLVYGDLEVYAGEGVMQLVEGLDLKLSDIESFIGLKEMKNKSFVDIFIEKIASLGVRVFGGRIIVEKEICIEDVCVNKNQLKALLQNSGVGSSGSGGSGSVEQVTEPVEEDGSEEEVAGTSTTTDTTTDTETTAEPAPTEPVVEDEPVAEPTEPIIEEETATVTESMLTEETSTDINETSVLIN